MAHCRCKTPQGTFNCVFKSFPSRMTALSYRSVVHGIIQLLCRAGPDQMKPLHLSSHKRCEHCCCDVQVYSKGVSVLCDITNGRGYGWTTPFSHRRQKKTERQIFSLSVNVSLKEYSTKNLSDTYGLKPLKSFPSVKMDSKWKQRLDFHLLSRFIVWATKHQKTIKGSKS